PPHATRSCGMLDYQTDARALHYLEAGGSLKRLDLIGASHARALRSGWLSFAASEAMTDLHVTVQGGVLDLEASRPPAQLRAEGDAIRGVRSVRLNHRDLPPPPADRADTLLVHAVDWAESFAKT
ncbi:MAG: Hepar protein, partial [Acidobacteria bacterium]|nr:Hepar protein [Acidobacteriota bacterium]